MDIKKIFNELLLDRDFRGSEKDCCVQDLLIVKSNLGDEVFFSLLKKAYRENKKLNIKTTSIFKDQITFDDVELI